MPIRWLLPPVMAAILPCNLDIAICLLYTSDAADDLIKLPRLIGVTA